MDDKQKRPFWFPATASFESDQKIPRDIANGIAANR
jgi:hypothetical protein